MTKYTDEIARLFKRVRALLGAGVRSVELPDDTLCALLDVAIEDYADQLANSSKYQNVSRRELLELAKDQLRFDRAVTNANKNMKNWT